jgi:hypothetical protein
VRLARVEVPAQVEAPAPAPAAQLLADQVLSSTNDPLYIQRGDKVREALAEAGVLDIPDLAVRVLTRLTGTWIMIAAFENLYGFLWGGQVTLLRDMAGAPMPLARAAAFFEEWRKRNPSAPPDSIDRWIAFLETNGLLEKQRDQLHPTIKGHSFLHFLQEFNRPDPMFYR